MPKTVYEDLLYAALQARQVKVESQHSDGHKHVDLYLPEADIYIEIDGLQHLTKPEQIVADFKREHYSDMENFKTLHIPNEMLVRHLDKIADAIAKVVADKKELRR